MIEGSIVKPTGTPAVLATAISGGQTGADQAGWRAARAYGIPSGGWMPLEFRTERGPSPELAAFGAVEIPTGEYRTRTESNVRDSDATLWFGSPDSNGAEATIKACEQLGRPYFLVLPGSGIRPPQVAEW